MALLAVGFALQFFLLDGLTTCSAFRLGRFQIVRLTVVIGRCSFPVFRNQICLEFAFEKISKMEINNRVLRQQRLLREEREKFKNLHNWIVFLSTLMGLAALILFIAMRFWFENIYAAGWMTLCCKKPKFCL